MTCAPASGTDHCCYVDGRVCPFYDPDPAPNAGGHCSLRTKHGDWRKVHADPRYQTEVAVTWRRIGVVDCGDWAPTPEHPCAGCGWDGT